MANIQVLSSLDAPELDVYARLTQAQLRNRLEPEKIHCACWRDYDSTWKFVFTWIWTTCICKNSRHAVSGFL